MKRKKDKAKKEAKKVEAPISAEEPTLEVMEEELTKEAVLENDLKELKDKHLRLFAEFENYRNRMAKAQLQATQNATSKTLLKILPVLDDFNRAAQSEEFSEGVNLVYKKLNTSLEQLGVKPMESTGQLFDPEIHEAITEIPAPSKDLAGKVVDTVENGYYLNDKVFRFAKVVVGKV